MSTERSLRECFFEIDEVARIKKHDSDVSLGTSNAAAIALHWASATAAKN